LPQANEMGGLLVVNLPVAFNVVKAVPDIIRGLMQFEAHLRSHKCCTPLTVAQIMKESKACL
jgi:hypothetical protein